jgi:hypothetical protein
METEHEICSRYEKEFAFIALLDRLYYLNPYPSLTDRDAYAARKALLEALRSRFYIELAGVRECWNLRRCRSHIRSTCCQRRLG